MNTYFFPAIILTHFDILCCVFLSFGCIIIIYDLRHDVKIKKIHIKIESTQKNIFVNFISCVNSTINLSEDNKSGKLIQKPN